MSKLLTWSSIESVAENDQWCVPVRLNLASPLLSIWGSPRRLSHLPLWDTADLARLVTRGSKSIQPEVYAQSRADPRELSVEVGHHWRDTPLQASVGLDSSTETHPSLYTPPKATASTTTVLHVDIRSGGFVPATW